MVTRISIEVPLSYSRHKIYKSQACCVYRFLISNTWAHIICWANALLTCSQITARAEQPNKCTSWLILSTKTSYGLVLTPRMVMLVKVVKQRRVKRSSSKEQLCDTFFFFFLTSVEDKIERLWSWSGQKITGVTMKLRMSYNGYKYNSISLDKTFSDLLFNTILLKDIFCLIQLYLYLELQTDNRQNYFLMTKVHVQIK